MNILITKTKYIKIKCKGKAIWETIQLVVDENTNKSKIEQSIKTMLNYFEGYESIVNFISQEEPNKNHNKLSHGEKVIRYGTTSEQNN